MRRMTVGLTVLAFAVGGGFAPPARAESISRCTVAFHINVMPRVAFTRTVHGSGVDPRLPAAECRGRPAGPWAGPDPAKGIPEFDIDVDVAT